MKRVLLILAALLAGGATLDGSAAAMHASHHHSHHKHHRHVHRHHARHYTYRTAPVYPAAPGTTYSYGAVTPSAPVLQPAPHGPVILEPSVPMSSASVTPGFEGGMGPGGSGMPGSQSPGGIGR